ncbi:DUF4190 domain-containing protein [Nocardia camponoti]|uniref:DUF4190 domain-containing protein n=1 Tax=Nocardia camponoti TaxID=1616106 RepID=A0A917QUX3_9NOCA|nr:DUF4190 domain-containing protein [Nocardia camponoti]GGK69651.1 hypothetical protein GCM10011591_47220 [Nocardia camponoti]
MTNPGDSDEWWKQYGGSGVSPESGAPGSVPQYPTAQPSQPSQPAQPSPPSYPSTPQYPTAPPPSAPQYPQQPYGQPQPYPGQPAYGAPYQPYGYAQPQAQGTNGMAIASLVTSLTGLVTCGLGGIVGLILGFIALNQTKEPGQEAGRGLAIAGVIIGALMTIGIVVWFVFLIIGLAGSSSSSY